MCLEILAQGDSGSVGAHSPIEFVQLLPPRFEGRCQRPTGEPLLAALPYPSLVAHHHHVLVPPTVDTWEGMAVGLYPFVVAPSVVLGCPGGWRGRRLTWLRTRRTTRPSATAETPMSAELMEPYCQSSLRP